MFFELGIKVQRKQVLLIQFLDLKSDFAQAFFENWRHIPGPSARTKYFCPGQNQICPRQNNFVHDKIFFVHDKNFVHSLKIIFALRKLVSSHGQNLSPGQKIFCHGQNYYVWDKSDFVQDKKYFVQADGQGISRIHSNP